MDIETTKTGDVCVISLKGDLNIYSSPALCEELKSIFEKCAKVALDLAGVSEMDTSGLQCLLAAKKYSFKNQKAFKIINHSPAIIKMIDLLGLIGYFGDKIKIPADERSKYSLKYGIKKQRVVI
ncbi:MAG: STAS domain-containing protein [Spirochaetia bacterium]|nr:STAS domain-containing protein [Spirochaetia bacterium]